MIHEFMALLFCRDCDDVSTRPSNITILFSSFVIPIIVLKGRKCRCTVDSIDHLYCENCTGLARITAFMINSYQLFDGSVLN